MVTPFLAALACLTWQSPVATEAPTEADFYPVVSLRRWPSNGLHSAR
jgi:hypothetical protein